MGKNDLIEFMVGLLVEALEQEGRGSSGKADSRSPLLGANAVISSIGLVSLITDIESVLEEDHGIEVTLVSEDAFSRRQSPFRTIETLAEYILELSGASVNDTAQKSAGE